jgi:hypothetical protein
MNVGAIGAITGGGGAVYALSPYLNGVVRTSDAVAAAQAATASAAAAKAQATLAPAAATGAPTTAVENAQSAAPFANPAISEIAQQNAIAASLGGDAGFLVQSYGAVALAYGPQALAQVYIQPLTPVIPPVAPVPRVAPVANVV